MIWLRTCGSVVLAVLASSCTSSSKQDGGPTMERTAEGSSAVEGPWEYRVWFGTNRRPVDPADLGAGFSGERAADGVLHLGTCTVSIPRTHRFGSVGSGWWHRWRHGDDRLRLEGIEPLAGEAFSDSIRETLADFGSDDVLLYVHGFNTSFEAAAIRAAQIGFDLKVPGVTAFFSWPSKGSIHGYPADEAAVGAAENELQAFMERLVAGTSAGRVHVIAHSMGNRVLGSVVRELSMRTDVRFGQIILAAPDIDADVFRSLAQAYPQVSQRTTLYVSSKDRALEASHWLHDFDRAGFAPPVMIVAGIDTVEVSQADLTLLGHGYVAQLAATLYDMSQLLRSDLPPEHRPRLSSRKLGDGSIYWQLAP